VWPDDHACLRVVDVTPYALEGREVREQPWPIRLTHWISVVAIGAMAGSGLQIWVAYPFLGPRGALYSWFPLQGLMPPPALRLGEWLAGARHLHFAFAWILVVNALAYVGYEAFSGEWRRRVFEPRRDARNALATALHYLRVRPAPPELALYNGLQRLAYSGAIALGLVLVLSGLAIWKPVQLRLLGWLFGGYDGARAAHFIGLIALAAFVVAHVIMVAAHPRSFLAMITGGRRG
jgi:thiosulfate reductase cytochrome b subunit